MRVTAAFAHLRRDESGTAALMVAVSLLALFGSAAVAVDLGNLWASRRHVIVASDAAALGAASDYAVGRSGCATASDLVFANDPDAGMTDCTPTVTGPASGYVTVEAETPVDYAFASVLGVPDRTVGARTSAAWGLPSGANGLRPFGLCKDDPSFQAWVANPRGKSSTARVFYTHGGTNCGSAPGNWAIIDLDNVNPVDNDDTQRWIRHGYSGLARPGDIGGSPGAISNSLDHDLAAVNGEDFPIPVFDRVLGGGSNSRFRVVGFVGIELVGWQTTGPESTRYLDVRFTEMVGSGECCDNNGPDFGLRVVHICDVDPEFDPTHCES